MNSIRECHENLIAKEKGSWENNSNLYLPPDDKLGKTLAAIKALQSRSHNRVAQLRIADRDLSELIPATYGNENIVAICEQLRELAVRVARQIISDECKLLLKSPLRTLMIKKGPRKAF